MEIRPAHISDRAAWDAFVLGRAEASPYHLTPWRLAIAEVYGHQDVSLVATEDGVITGILPLVLMKTPLIGSRLVALPFCDVGGCLATNPDAGQVLINRARHLAAELGAATFELRGDPPAAALDHGDWQRIAHDKVLMQLTLPDSSAVLWASFKSKLRSQVAKAEKNDLVFRWGTEADVTSFYRVWSVNMRDLGSPAHARGWFAAVLRHYGPLGHLGLVTHGEIVVAAGILLRCGTTISVPWASTLREYNRLNPNMLLYWNFLHMATDSDCRTFDFGRSTANEGTYRFKAQWGAQPTPLIWHRSPPDKTATATDPGPRALAERLWQRLPLTVANTVGPLIRKHISL